jgi:hypothetical protein
MPMNAKKDDEVTKLKKMVKTTESGLFSIALEII